MTARPCPWPGCQVMIKPSRLMCPRDWYRLPADIRARILAAYRPGQTALTCSPEYRAALRDALAYARASAEDRQR